jgi:mannose-1-phosphate guanylyltransferase/phosphomannomutase
LINWSLVESGIHLKAVILAGGKGSRLGPLTQKLPKVLIPIGGKPIIEHQLEWLAREGLKEVIILTGHLHKEIESFCGNGDRWGLRLSYCVETEPLGTAGALKEAETQILQESQSPWSWPLPLPLPEGESLPFLVVYGDVMVDMNIESLWRFHFQKKNPCATLMVHPNDHPHDSDLVEFEDDFRISVFHGKPHDPGRFYHNQVNAAVYLLNPRIFSYLVKGKALDLGRDVFPYLVSKESFYAYPSAEYLKDMGSPDRLLAVEEDYLSGKIKKINRRNPRPAIFLDRDGVICKHVDFLYDENQLELFDDVADALKRINKSGYLAIVVTNQPLVAKGFGTEKGIRELHKKMEFILGENGAWFDSIYFCPHHPDGQGGGEKNAYVCVCDCRKPAPGMLQRAAQFFNIDLSKSFIVGDTWRDIGTGRAAELRMCFGLAQGPGRVGEFKNEKPDRTFVKLSEAIDFILSIPNGELKK